MKSEHPRLDLKLKIQALNNELKELSILLKPYTKANFAAGLQANCKQTMYTVTALKRVCQQQLGSPLIHCVHVFGRESIKRRRK